jgi:hypothetical protein
MEPEKNLHATVPPALRSRAQEAAQRARISLDKLVSDAVEQRLNRQGFEEVLAFGKRHAQARRVKPGDVAKAIADVRSEKTKRGY